MFHYLDFRGRGRKPGCRQVLHPLEAYRHLEHPNVFSKRESPDFVPLGFPLTFTFAGLALAGKDLGLVPLDLDLAPPGFWGFPTFRPFEATDPPSGGLSRSSLPFSCALGSH